MALSFTRTLHNGIEIPFPGFDLSSVNEADAYNSIRESLEKGARHFYLSSISTIESDLLKAADDAGLKRQDLFLTYSITLPQKDENQMSHEISLLRKHSKAEYADLLLIGWSGGNDAGDPDNGFADTAWKTAEGLFKSGQARAIGVMDFTAWQIEYLLQKSEIAPMAVLFPVYPGHASKDLLHSCKDHNALAISCLHRNMEPLNSANEIAILARKHQCSPQDIILQYQLQNKCSLFLPENPGAVNPPYINLDESEMAYLDHMKDYLE